MSQYKAETFSIGQWQKYGKFQTVDKQKPSNVFGFGGARYTMVEFSVADFLLNDVFLRLTSQLYFTPLDIRGSTRSYPHLLR